jgi:hypothetical protein
VAALAQRLVGGLSRGTLSSREEVFMEELRKGLLQEGLVGNATTVDRGAGPDEAPTDGRLLQEAAGRGADAVMSSDADRAAAAEAAAAAAAAVPVSDGSWGRMLARLRRLREEQDGARHVGAGNEMLGIEDRPADKAELIEEYEVTIGSLEAAAEQLRLSIELVDAEVQEGRRARNPVVLAQARARASPHHGTIARLRTAFDALLTNPEYLGPGLSAPGPAPCKWRVRALSVLQEMVEVRYSSEAPDREWTVVLPVDSPAEVPCGRRAVRGSVLLDTGAQNTFINERAAEAARLLGRGRVDEVRHCTVAGSFGGRAVLPSVPVDIRLAGFVVHNTRAFVDLAERGVDVVIGRDILGQLFAAGYSVGGTEACAGCPGRQRARTEAEWAWRLQQADESQGAAGWDGCDDLGHALSAPA